MLKNFSLLLLATFLLAGCGSFTISFGKDDKESTENVASNNTTPKETEEKEEKETTETPKETTETQQVKKEQSSPTPAKDSIVRTEADNSGSYVVPTRDVNIRATPSIDGKIISSGAGNEPIVYLNEKVYTNDNRVWLKVQSDSQTVGYVSSRYAEVTSGTMWDTYYESDYAYVIVTENEANIRYNTNQNDSSAVIEKASAGETFTFTGVIVPAEGRDWYKVYSSSGEVGYISSRVSDLRY